MATEESLKRAREDATRIERESTHAWDRSDPVNEGAIQRTMADRKLSRADAVQYLRGLRDGQASVRGDSNEYRTDDK